MMQTDKEDKLILSRAEDAVKIAEQRFCVHTVGFLNPHQRSLILKNIYPRQDVKMFFEGGYEDAERTLFIAAPEYEEVDITGILKVIKVSGRDVKGLTHRDYLGSLMGLGITRENIGDILASEGGALIFVKAEIAEYILINLEKIGRHGIKTELYDSNEIEIPKPKTREIKGTVSSLRLDAVLSLGAGISRSRGAELIGQGLVSLNFEACESVSHEIGEGDLISVRGFGRMKLIEIGGVTRKGRTGIVIEKYE